MPDDMLEDSIAIAKKTLDEHDFETDGVEVSHRLTFKNIVEMILHWYSYLFMIDCQKSQEVHGRKMGAILARFLRKVFRLPFST